MQIAETLALRMLQNKKKHDKHAKTKEHERNTKYLHNQKPCASKSCNSNIWNSENVESSKHRSCNMIGIKNYFSIDNPR